MRDKVHTRSDGSTFIEKVWNCPAVVVALNEGSYNSTGVCLDCILEAAHKLWGSTGAIGSERDSAATEERTKEV